MELSRKRQQAARAKSTPRRLLILRILAGISVVMLITGAVTAVWYLTRLETLTIDSVDVVGGITIPQSEIERVVNETLTGTYYRLVPKRFVYTYPNEQISERVARIPRVKQVLVERSGRTVQVVFEEYVPHALWCDPADLQGDCVFMDTTGYGFVVAPELFGSALVRYYHYEEKPRAGGAVFSEALMDRTSEFMIAAEEQLGLRVVSVTQSAPTELRYEVAGGGAVVTTLDLPLETMLKNLATVLTSEEFADLKPGNFQYIDLRFGNKVFVNETPLDTATSTSIASSTATTTL